MIASKLAAMAPDRVASLALLNTTGGGYQCIPKVGVAAHSRPAIQILQIMSLFSTSLWHVQKKLHLFVSWITVSLGGYFCVFVVVVCCVVCRPFPLAIDWFSGLGVAYYWATEIDQNKHDTFKGEFKIWHRQRGRVNIIFARINSW